MSFCLFRISLVLWCISSWACGDYRPRTTPPDRQSDTVRVVTWNVLNLYDHADDPQLSGQWDDAPLATPTGRCESIASVLRLLNADIVALQEVESLACLSWFRDTFLVGMGYQFIASIDGGYHRGVECAVLSRFPFQSVSIDPPVMLFGDDAACAGGEPRHQEGAVAYPRPPLRVTIDYGDGILAFVVVHHKAGGGELNTWRREAEACCTAASISAWRALHPHCGLIVLGDFNANAAEASVRVYRKAGLCDVMPNQDVATHESGRRTDYILATPDLASRVVAGTACVLGIPRPPYGWNWKTDPRPDWSPSDHFPVLVDIQRSSEASCSRAARRL